MQGYNIAIKSPHYKTSLSLSLLLLLWLLLLLLLSSLLFLLLFWLGFCILFLDLRIWGFLYFLTSGFLYFGICGFLEFGFWIVGFLDSGILDCWISTAVCKFDCSVVVVGKLYLCTPRAFVIASLPSPLSSYHC
jgi:hypothetical protein